MSELTKRVLSGSLLASLVIGDLWLGSWWFAALLALGVLLVLREYGQLVLKMTPATGRRIAWMVLGIIYVGAAGYGLWRVRGMAFGGFFWSIWLYVIVWAVDIGAYATGRTFGGPKIAPTISPSKTWAGLAGGMAGAAGFSAIMASLSELDPLHFALLSLPIAVIAQAGDFFESWMKRQAGVKDSGALIPGHGGLFDRVDGLLPVAIVFPWWMGLAL